jgi:hypothetical protein
VKLFSFYFRYHCFFARTSNPLIRALNSSGRNEALAPSPAGHVKRPRSNRFAQTHNPDPSQQRILSRVRRALVKTNK